MTCLAWVDWGAAIIDLIVAMVPEDCASAAQNGTAMSWGSGMCCFPLDSFELLVPLFSPGLLRFSHDELPNEDNGPASIQSRPIKKKKNSACCANVILEERRQEIAVAYRLPCSFRYTYSRMHSHTFAHAQSRGHTCTRRRITPRERMKRQNGFCGVGRLGSTDTLNYISESIPPWKGGFVWGCRVRRVRSA